jgi:hypothetical protein
MALTWALAASDISPFPSLAGIVDLALVGSMRSGSESADADCDLSRFDGDRV